MAHLIDTSILGRLGNYSDPLHSVTIQAVTSLHRRKELLHITAQNIIEYRNMATRPIAVNGLGFSSKEADVDIKSFEAQFTLLHETPDIFPAWKNLVESAEVIGKQVHDARLVAVCHVYKITHLLTYNVAHFTRLAAFNPGLIVVDPLLIVNTS